MTAPLQHITVIGSGSWAIALVKIFSENRIHTHWFLRKQEQVDFVQQNGRHPNYLGFLQLDLDFVHPTASLENAIAAADDLIAAIPSGFLDQAIGQLQAELFTNKRLYVSVKGLVGEELLTPSAYFAQVAAVPEDAITLIAGPCHAEEVAMGRKTYLTISGKHPEIVNRLASAIQSPYLHVVTNNDPVGVELAAILKNVIGIASGIIKGLNYGDNFLAVVVSNSLREISVFLQKCYPYPRDLFDSAYFGDLLVTAYSNFSRNRNFGHMIGRGYSVQAAESSMTMIAEGFRGVKGMFAMAKARGIHMPVLTTIYRILYHHSSPMAEFRLLENQLK